MQRHCSNRAFTGSGSITSSTTGRRSGSRVPGMCQIPAGQCCHYPTPDASERFANPIGQLTPMAMCGFGPHPVGGICNKSDLLRTYFESNCFAELHDKVFPARPHSRRAKVHETEFGYYSRLVTGDYFKYYLGRDEFPSNDSDRDLKICNISL